MLLTSSWFRRALSATLGASTVLTVCLGAVSSVSGETMAQRQRNAEGLVREALHREVFGEVDERQKLLESAQQERPDYAPAKWHAGLVHFRNRWIKADEIPDLLAKDLRIITYRKMRDETADTVAGQYELAMWCLEKKLTEQARAHLTRVLELDPDNLQARQLLGFRQVDGVWLSRTERNAAQQTAAKTSADLQKWSGEMGEIRKIIENRSLRTREAGIARLRKINDPSAIPAMESMVAMQSQQAGSAVVMALAGIDAHESSVALARQAVFSPWEQVRQDAVAVLQERSFDHYVPALLATLATPISSRSELFQDASGRLIYRHMFFREGQENRQLAVLETAYRRISAPGGDGSDAANLALNDIMGRAVTGELRRMRQNIATEELNDRVMWVLRRACDGQIDMTPEAWWDWWNQYNEVYTEQQKPLQTRVQQREIALIDQTGFGGGSGTGGGGGGGCDCLAAGTLIWTDQGPVAIEHVQVGDLVLTQHPSTGELTYKPVLRTTIRPPGELIAIEAIGDSFVASGGHKFWVSGEGWVRARDLQSGMELHTARGTLRISSVGTAPRAQTFNMVVADFHTYFVGESMTLSHDNTISEPTNVLVPGLSEK
jgi:hypothetical protein